MCSAQLRRLTVHGPGMAWQSGIPDMLAASSMAMPAICIDATCVSESSLGQAYIANATCERARSRRDRWQSSGPIA
jgi:hypothetical protein